MAASNPNDLVPIVTEYRRSLEECEDLYRSCALECAHSHLQHDSESEDAFVERMVDLSHGLMLKIFLEIASLDPHATNDLTWDALFGPFERYKPFRQRADRVRTLVPRLANLVAKANGRLTPEEVRQLRWIQAEMRRILDPIPLAGTQPEAPAPTGSQAIEEAPFEIVVPPGAEGGRRQAVVVQDKPPAERLEEGLAELDGLIGLKSIKQEVRGLINFLKMQQARAEFDLPQTAISLHHVFSGNPGTGKTTVARLLGRLFGAMGLLAKGHLVETDRSGLVAEYAGQTAPKAHKKIDEALDGVLFIDEAYSLVAERGDDPYGAEALQVLLKRMEDDRSRLVLVLAGYPRPLERLLGSNPGPVVSFQPAAGLSRLLGRRPGPHLRELVPAEPLPAADPDAGQAPARFP